MTELAGFAFGMRFTEQRRFHRGFGQAADCAGCWGERRGERGQRIEKGREMNAGEGNRRDSQGRRREWNIEEGNEGKEMIAGAAGLTFKNGYHLPLPAALSPNLYLGIKAGSGYLCSTGGPRERPHGLCVPPFQDSHAGKRPAVMPRPNAHGAVTTAAGQLVSYIRQQHKSAGERSPPPSAQALATIGYVLHFPPFGLDGCIRRGRPVGKTRGGNRLGGTSPLDV